MIGIHDIFDNSLGNDVFELDYLVSDHTADGHLGFAVSIIVADFNTSHGIELESFCLVGLLH